MVGWILLFIYQVSTLMNFITNAIRTSFTSIQKQALLYVNNEITFYSSVFTPFIVKQSKYYFGYSKIQAGTESVAPKIEATLQNWQRAS